MDSNRLSKAYNEFYYTHNCGDQPYQRNEGWLNFFGSVADRIVRDIGPSTVLDAGCAMGFLVETLRARAVDAVGVDISEYAIEKAHADVRPFCWVGAVTDPFPRKYDLIVCIEVLEHLSPQEADRAIENFCTHADDILFSSTPFDYKEATHINVRPPDYWAQRFAQHEFYRDIDFDASFLTPWAVRFRKTCDPAWRIVYSYERQLWQLEKEIQARRQLTVEQMNQLSEAQQQVGALTGKASENEETIKSLTAEITRQQETIESLAGLANKEQSQQGLAQNNDKSQPVPDQLPAQLSEQYEKIESIISAIVLQQSAMEGLISQASEKEKTIERLRAELSDKQQSEQKLGLQIAEARTTIETLLAQKQENEQAVRALSMEMAHREHAVRASKAREKGTAFTLNALSQRLAEREKAIEWLSSQLADKEALIAYQEAKLADVNSSMVWWLYNRIKYPYLLFLFRLYERIKYPYLIRLYRRLGLAASPPASPQPTQAAANASLLPANTFPVIEVTATPALLPHRASVDIIICVHNALEDVKRCLDSVVCHTRMPYSLILVDDGSNDETRAYLVSFADSQSALLIRNEQAKGYTFAANQGLKRSRSEYVVLLNSDTVVTPLWLDRMVACGESNSQVGLVGPLSNVASWQSIPEIICDGDWAENRLPAGFSVADMGKLVGQYSARLYPRIPFLNGFCLMIKRGVLEQIGYFDEAVFGKGYGEENDFCLRARKAGWQLAIADDTYIYHAQSRSYSHERRKELSKQADVALATKHEPQMIIDGVKKCRFDRVLEGVRARNRAMVERKQLLEAGMKLWEGKRVSFILPIADACGGGNVVLDEAEAMRKMGVDAHIINLSCHQASFDRSYPDNSVPVLYSESESRIPELIVDYDAVIATFCASVYWLGNAPRKTKKQIKGYYIQDFEPHFFNPETPEFRMAWNSYTAHPDLIPFTKTEWNQDAVRNNTGVECSVVGPSMNIDLFRPRRRHDPDWPVRPLRIAAMIRPSTLRRNPKLTMEVLREHHRVHGDNIEIILFGCESSDPQFLALPHDFAWRNAGMLTRPQLAFLLNGIDVFVDFSEFQAMGLTAMEAMACGVAVIVPQKGGTDSFAIHNQNSLIIDTSSQGTCLEALERLTMDENLRAELQQQAIRDVCKYYPERAAYNTLKALFSAAPNKEYE